MPLGKDVDLGPGDIVLYGDPAPPQRGTAPNFRSMSIVAKRSTISATAELLLSHASRQKYKQTDIQRHSSHRSILHSYREDVITIQQMTSNSFKDLNYFLRL